MSSNNFEQAMLNGGVDPNQVLTGQYKSAQAPTGKQHGRAGSQADNHQQMPGMPYVAQRKEGS